MMYYILEGKEPKPTNDISMFSNWMETANRVVKKTELPDDVEVSTVFLGLDHRMYSSENPILFETMVLGGDNDGYTLRYETWDEAEKGHEKVVSLIMNRFNLNFINKDGSIDIKAIAGAQQVLKALYEHIAKETKLNPENRMIDSCKIIDKILTANSEISELLDTIILPELN